MQQRVKQFQCDGRDAALKQKKYDFFNRSDYVYKLHTCHGNKKEIESTFESIPNLIK